MLLKALLRGGKKNHVWSVSVVVGKDSYSTWGLKYPCNKFQSPRVIGTGLFISPQGSCLAKIAQLLLRAEVLAPAV